MHEWFQLALDRSVVKRALVCSVVVGTILIAINHGDSLVRGELSQAQMIKIALTPIVPYLVSTISSVGALRAARKKD
jgi:hypothetical protein